MTIVADLADEKATAAFGGALARLLRQGDILCLHGDLGAGKSSLARAVIRRAAQDPVLEVPSPTFTLVQTYETDPGEIWHFDLYRLADPDEVLELGWEDAIADGIALIEWPDRLGGLLPAVRLDITLEADPQAPGRRIIVDPRGGDWQGRLDLAVTTGELGRFFRRGGA